MMFKDLINRVISKPQDKAHEKPPVARPPAPPQTKSVAHGRIKLYGEGVDVDLEQVFSEDFLLVFAAGIVNPFGPTLTAILVRKSPRSDGSAEVIQVMLNPFSQTAQIQAVVPDQDSISMVDVLQHVPIEWLGSCPTLLIPGKSINTDVGVLELGRLLRKLHDSRETLESLERSPSNPWDRVSNEMESAAARAIGGMESDDQSLLGPSGSKRLIRILLDEEHFDVEMKAFLVAWQGSIENGMGGMATLEFE